MGDDRYKKCDCDDSCNCIGEIIKKIIYLQNNSYKKCDQEGCDRPFLGPDNQDCYNTRPVSFYNCTTGLLWSIDCATIFRIESLDGCCCKCRILKRRDNEYVSTNDFFTINLNCISAIKCHKDIDLCI